MTTDPDSEQLTDPFQGIPKRSDIQSFCTSGSPPLVQDVL